MLVGSFDDHHGFSRVAPAGNRTRIDYHVGRSACAVHDIHHP
jgi:hypothetical protein